MKFIYGLLLSTVFTSLTAQALPLPKGARNSVMLPRSFTANYGFEGIVALSNCSGSIFRLENSQDTDHAMILTNGHCYEGGFINPGTYLINVDSSRRFTVLDATGNDLGTVHATMVIYGTMTQSDMTIYRLQETYADILKQYNTRAFTLSSQHPAVGQSIDVVSGYWQRGYSCQIEAFIDTLKEGDWTWQDSIRYSRPGCEVIGGTSGSPVILSGTRTIVGVNNTGNEDGERCTVNNPCEVDKSGNVTYQQGYSYAEETYWLYSCLNSTGQIDMSAKGCLLPH